MVRLWKEHERLLVLVCLQQIWRVKLSENWYCLLLVEAFAPAEEEAFCLEEQKACRIGQKQELSFQMTASVDSTVRPAAVAARGFHVLSTMAP